MAARKRARNKSANNSRATERRRKSRTKPQVSHAHSLNKLRKWLFPNDSIFASLRLHGNTSWRPNALVWLGLGWAWAESRNVTDAFDTAVGQCRQLGVASLSTYQGFMNALVVWTDRLMDLMWPILHQRMQQIGTTFWQVGGWVPVAFDGSRNTAPRSQANEKAYCAANYGKGKTAKYRKKKTKGMRRSKNEKNQPQPQEPQVWITLMWHMGLRLPWMWRLGPSNSSERTHVMEMLDGEEFPENTLFCGDAGFVGYRLWEQILSRGFHFLVRVGANVHLLTELADCRIAADGKVLCWPKAAMQAGQPALQLRLVRVKIGKTWVWLLTSVLSATKLNKRQMVRLYQMRWGIEVEFRGLKQTLDRAKLRCRNDKRVLVELHWSLMAMAVAELFALKEQLRPRSSRAAPENPPPDPKRRSLANTVRALRYCLTHLSETPTHGRTLHQQLRNAITDGYLRKSPKRARYRPPNPDKKPLGDPKIHSLTVKAKKKLNAQSSQNIAA